MLTSVQILIISLCFLGLILGITIYLIKNHNKNRSDHESFDSYDLDSYMLIDNLSGKDLIPTSVVKDPKSNSSMIYYEKSNDPTQGYVNYGAWDNLIEVNPSGKFIVKAGSNLGEKRNMIRMYSRKSYNDGLFVIKADHIPEGNGVWPAFWLTSSDKTWSCEGEIDIIEGVNSIDSKSSRNTSTLHTNDGSGVCRQVGVAGIKNPICSSYGGKKNFECGCGGKEICPYEGCGVELKSTSSFGKGFNQGGGGIYATELTTDGFITIWFFPKGTEPQDLKDPNSTPNPSTWPISDNVIRFNQCKGNFKNLKMILNTDLCGTWAGENFINDKGVKGNDACNNYIKSADLSNAYWSIDYIKVYQKSGKPIPPSDCTITPCPSGYQCDKTKKSCVPIPPSDDCTITPCPSGYQCDKMKKSCVPIPPSADCTIIPCPSGYQCDKMKKSCVPIPPSADCYQEGENPFAKHCSKTACCDGTQLRLHPPDANNKDYYYICSSNPKYKNIPPKCDPKNTPAPCLSSSFCTPGCYENDEDVFYDNCKKGVQCCDGAVLCRDSNYKYYCHKGETWCNAFDYKVDPPPCPAGNCNVPYSKLCNYKSE